MTAYSLDLRRRVLAAADAGLGTAAVVARFAVSRSWVRRLKQRRAATGAIGPKPQRRGRVPSWEKHAAAIRAAVAAAPDATLAECRAALGLPLSRSALARALVRLGLTRKKSPCTPASRSGRT